MKNKSALDSFGKMLIGAWVAPAPTLVEYGNESLINDSVFKMLSESGINCIYALYDQFPLYEKEIYKAMDLCLKYGIFYLARDKNFSLSRFEDASSLKYLEHKACAGVLFCDEPGENSFKKIAQAQKMLEEVDDTKACYVNLLPVYAQKNQLEKGAAAWKEGERENGKQDYANYIQDYIDIVNPRFLSFDYYPMEGEFPFIKEDYFWQLSFIRSQASKYGISFYPFIQLCSWNKVKIRNPIQSEIEWQVSTAIAFGARGIQYFTFLNPFENALEGAAFCGNMLNHDGSKTEKFDIVQKINKHLESISRVVMFWQFESVLNINNVSGIRDCDLSDDFGIIKSVSADILVTRFSYLGYDAFYFVNNSLTVGATMEVTFNNVEDVQALVDNYTMDILSDKVALFLRAGQGALIYKK